PDREGPRGRPGGAGHPVRDPGGGGPNGARSRANRRRGDAVPGVRELRSVQGLPGAGGPLPGARLRAGPRAGRRDRRRPVELIHRRGPVWGLFVMVLGLTSVCGLNFQPAEMAKLGMILYLSNFLANRGERVREFASGVLPPLLIFVILAAAILKQPDLGSVLILGLITFAMLFAGGARLAHLFTVLAAAVPAALAVILRESYRSSRLVAFLDPWKDPRGAGFNIIQSLLAVGSGGLTGLGLGHSQQKFFYLPEAHTDFIFAIIGEELGLVGAAAVILLFVLLAVLGFQIASRIRDRYGVLLTSGLVTMLEGQA